MNLLQLVITVSVLLTTVAIHGGAVMLLFRLGRKPLAAADHLPAIARFGVSCMFIVGFLIAHLVEIGLWATVYRLAGQFHDFEEAAYFSAITFATIGYGDITLSTDWRLATAIEGVNGILLFGWTTAFLFRTSELMWSSRRISRPEE